GELGLHPGRDRDGLRALVLREVADLLHEQELVGALEVALGDVAREKRWLHRHEEELSRRRALRGAEVELQRGLSGIEVNEELPGDRHPRDRLLVSAPRELLES